MYEYGFGPGGFFVALDGVAVDGPFATPGPAKRAAQALDPKATRRNGPVRLAPQVGRVVAPAPGLLERGVRAVRELLATGAHDSDLPALRAAELAGANRKSALAAIDERAASLRS